jgi:hypothetical protein
MFIDNPLISTQVLLVVFWEVLWMIYDWYMIGISNLKPIKWQDGWFEMFYIVDFAIL